jgi:glycosyltransferase involved in cell wall biosynthesis
MRTSRAYPLALRAFRWYLAWLLEHATAICTPTRTAAALMNALGLSRRIEVISNGVDTSRFRPPDDRAATRRAMGFPDKPVVLYTGRLDAEKDMETWLRAAAALPPEIDAHLVLGGEGADKPRLQGIVHRLGLQSKVTFPGYLPVEQLPRLYQAADVYFITSAVELQSITTLEALATGLPVVAADAAALPELVVPGENGYLARPGDAASFRGALADILGSPALAARMGAAGRLLAERHSLEHVAARHEQLLESVAEQRSVAKAYRT